MLKKVIGTKGVSLLAGLVMVMSLSGCGNGLTEQDSASNNTETSAPVREEKTDTVQSETKEPTVKSEPASQPQAETFLLRHLKFLKWQMEK